MKYVLYTLLGLLGIGLIFTLGSVFMPKDYTIKQEVWCVDEYEQKELFKHCEDTIRSSIRVINIGGSTPKYTIETADNPYQHGNIVYKLISSCADSTYVDYGSKDRLMKLKCKRYRELLGYKIFETNKPKRIDSDLKELNSKTCN